MHMTHLVPRQLSSMPASPVNLADKGNRSEDRNEEVLPSKHDDDSMIELLAP